MTIRGEGREIHTSVLHFLVRTVGATSESKRKMLRIFFISGRHDSISEKKRRFEKAGAKEEISSSRIVSLYTIFSFIKGVFVEKKKEIKKTPCAREEIRANGKGSFARCWVRVRLIGGAVVSVGETFAGLDRALLYSEVSWRAPCGSLDRSSLGLGRAEKKSRWCVLGSAHDLLHRET